MAEHSTIEWTDATWNPITGCSVVSPGCTNCYAMRLAGTRLQHHPSRAGLTRDSKAGPVWTGEVRFNPQWLDQPLRWSKPRMIFVCAHGDLFHEAVPDDWIDMVFAIMAAAYWHTFQVLTKRADRMLRYLRFNGAAAAERWVAQSWKLAEAIPALKRIGWSWAGDGMPWPIPNVWLGVSAEDQQRADERIPHLLATPAAVRWVSAEPLLGPLFTDHYLKPPPDLPGRHVRLSPGEWIVDADGAHLMWRGLDWVVAGGESGPGARPMHPDWARSLRDQCASAGVPFHWKQWGEWHPMGQTLADGNVSCLDRGERPGEFHAWGDGECSTRLGKARAGRLLDGREHNGMPGDAA